jgi:hypothetical protein
MSFPLEYHSVVKCVARPSVPASLALLGMFAFPLLFVSTSPAQSISAASISAAHTISGSAPRVTSSGYNAHRPTNSGVTSSTKPPHSTNGSSHTNPHPQPRTPTGQLYYYYYPYAYAVPVPYAVETGDNGAADGDDPDYQGGPTVFDRRGSGLYSYIPPGSESPADPNAEEAQAQEQEAPSDDSNPNPEPSPDPTILVFKDGHQLEIENYAVVSQTLYDLTPGHPRKIALADIDLPATEEQNDDHGVTFQLPSSAQAN